MTRQQIAVGAGQDRTRTGGLVAWGAPRTAATGWTGHLLLIAAGGARQNGGQFGGLLLATLGADVRRQPTAGGADQQLGESQAEPGPAHSALPGPCAPSTATLQCNRLVSRPLVCNPFTRSVGLGLDTGFTCVQDHFRRRSSRPLGAAHGGDLDKPPMPVLFLHRPPGQ